MIQNTASRWSPLSMRFWLPSMAIGQAAWVMSVEKKNVVWDTAAA